MLVPLSKIVSGSIFHGSEGLISKSASDFSLAFFGTSFLLRQKG